MLKARRWLTDATLLNETEPIDRQRVPTSAFTHEQVKRMLEAGKLRPLGEDEPIFGFAKGFTVPEHAKQRLRPIFEPFANGLIDKEELVRTTYPSRHERQVTVRGATFCARFDFKAWFDQVDLPQDVQQHYAVRVKDAEGRPAFYCLTRLPMGACWAPGVAQTITWTIVQPLAKLRHVIVHTMIDDVRIAADDAQAFTTAVRTFMRRCRQANATLKNGDEWSQLSDKQLIEKGRTEATQYVFLGEEYLHAGLGAPKTRNCAKNVDKLRAACARFRERPQECTRRNFAAVMGLIVFMAWTVRFSLYKMPRLMRAYSAIASAATDERSWDAPVFLAPPVFDELVAVADVLLRNTPVPIPPASAQPSTDTMAYDAIIYVDASASGYGAFVALRDDRIYEVRGGWSALMPHSAHAEPLAARVVLDWLYATHPGTANVAVVSDHQPMATAQRRWFNHHGGFSGAWPLNAFFGTLYEGAPPGSFREVFYVPGEANVADAISRSNRVGDGLRSRLAGCPARPHNVLAPTRDTDCASDVAHVATGNGGSTASVLPTAATSASTTTTIIITIIIITIIISDRPATTRRFAQGVDPRP